MQDFNYDFTNAMELTIEVSCCKYPERNRLLGGLQCPLVFFTWLLHHVIYLKIRKNFRISGMEISSPPKISHGKKSLTPKGQAHERQAFSSHGLILR